MIKIKNKQVYQMKERRKEPTYDTKEHKESANLNVGKNVRKKHHRSG